jgi:subtilisin-like proprotein convertase family protein
MRMQALGLTASAASAATLSNSNGITINDAGDEGCDRNAQALAPGLATPYPSEIAVSGLDSSVSDVNVTVRRLAHRYAADIGLLLVSPAGKDVILMSDSGGNFPVNGINLTFDDGASGPVPPDDPLTSGTFKPSRGSHASGCFAPASFPAQAPAGPYGSTLSVFDGSNPNGTWKLYVIDDTSGGAGSISGWSLDITAVVSDTTAPGETINQASTQADTTSISPIHFTAVFDELVTGFTDSDVTLSGAAGATTTVVTEQAPTDGTTYDIAVSGMTTSGTVIASIPAGAAQDAAQNGNTASTSTDNTVNSTAEQPDSQAPKVISTFPRNGGKLAPPPTSGPRSQRT